jgi:hypothetical protein
MLELTWDSRDLEFWRNRKTEAALLRAASKAGGDALRSLKTAGVKVVRERKRFKAARVNKAMPLFYPRGERDLTSLVWRMDVSGKPVPLVDLPHSQTKRGVSVAVNAGGRKLLRSAFLATMKSGHEGIFRRVGSSRLPIKEAFTTRVSDVFNDQGVIPAVLGQAELKFQSAFLRLLPLELKK